MSLDELIGPKRKAVKTYFFNGKALIFSFKRKLDIRDNGWITIIDLDSKRVVIDLENIYFNYQNLLVSADDTKLYIGETGSEVLFEHNFAHDTLRKINIPGAAKAVSYSNLLIEGGLFYFLESPYGSTIISKENAVYKNACRGGVMNSNYATISKPISNKINLITGCLNEKADSIQIIAIDEHIKTKWTKSIGYSSEGDYYFQIFNTGSNFLVANGTSISLLSYEGNALWSIQESNTIFKCAINDSSLFVLSRKKSTSSDLLFKIINLSTGSVVDSVELRSGKPSNGNIFGMSISSNHAFIQYTELFYTISLQRLQNVSVKNLSEPDGLLEITQDNFSGKVYTIFDNTVLW